MTPTRRSHVEHSLTVADGVLVVHEWRVEEADRADPLVLLHGFTGSGRSLEGVVPLLAYPGRILTPDLPGHGDSRFGDDPRVHTMEAAAAALDTAFTVLDAPRVVLGGYSMGGRLALYYVLTRPERVARLLLESTSAGIEDSNDRATRVTADEELAQYALAHGIERFVERWERTPVLASQARLSADARARVRALRVSSTPAGLAASLRGMGAGAQPYLGRRLAEIAAPTLVVAGADDAKFAAMAAALARGIPGAELAVIPGVGHTPHLEDPASWADVVGRFVNVG